MWYFRINRYSRFGRQIILRSVFAFFQICQSERSFPNFIWEKLILSYLLRFGLNTFFSLVIVHFLFRTKIDKAGFLLITLVFLIVFPIYLYCIHDRFQFDIYSLLCETVCDPAIDSYSSYSCFLLSEENHSGLIFQRMLIRLGDILTVPFDFFVKRVDEPGIQKSGK
jgi:exosortase F-associated protein